jgi:hypothetical protein
MSVGHPVTSTAEFERRMRKGIPGSREVIMSEEIRTRDKRISELESEVRSLVRQLDELKGRGKITPQEIRANLGNIIEKFGCEPIEEVLRMCYEKDAQDRYILSPDQRIRVLLEVNQYRMPKLKSVEHSGEVKHNIQVVLKRSGELEAGAPREVVVGEYQIGDRGRLLSAPNEEATK